MTEPGAVTISSWKLVRRNRYNVVDCVQLWWAHFSIVGTDNSSEITHTRTADVAGSESRLLVPYSYACSKYLPPGFFSRLGKDSRGTAILVSLTENQEEKRGVSLSHPNNYSLLIRAVLLCTLRSEQQFADSAKRITKRKWPWTQES